MGGGPQGPGRRTRAAGRCSARSDENARRLLEAPWHIRRQTRLTGDSENALPGAFIRNVPNQTGYITRATSLFMPTGWHGRLNGAPVTALALSCSFTPPGGEAGGATRKQVSSAEENGRKKTYPAAADEPL